MNVQVRVDHVKLLLRRCLHRSSDVELFGESRVEGTAGQRGRNRGNEGLRRSLRAVRSKEGYVMSKLDESLHGFIGNPFPGSVSVRREGMGYGGKDPDPQLHCCYREARLVTWGRPAPVPRRRR